MAARPDPRVVFVPLPPGDPGVPKLVELAKRYPGERPKDSYVFTDGSPAELAAEHGGLLADQRRTALFAYGANASPRRLAWKLSQLDGPQHVPVLCARLHGFDAGYSAHVSMNGAISGTLRASAGTVMEAHVLLVTGEQLEVITAVEFNYDLLTLDGVELELEGGAERGSVLAYASKHGCVTLGGEPVAMAAIDAQGRIATARDELEVQSALRDLLDSGHDLDAFIARSITDAEERDRRTAEIKRTAAPLGLGGAGG